MASEINNDLANLELNKKGINRRRVKKLVSKYFGKRIPNLSEFARLDLNALTWFDRKLLMKLQKLAEIYHRVMAPKKGT